MFPTVPCLTGTTTTRTTATITTVSVLCVPALKATQAAGNNRNPPVKTFRTGLFCLQGTVFPYNANAFAGLVLVAHRSSLASAQARLFLFCAILIFY